MLKFEAPNKITSCGCPKYRNRCLILRTKTNFRVLMFNKFVVFADTSYMYGFLIFFLIVIIFFSHYISSVDMIVLFRIKKNLQLKSLSWNRAKQKGSDRLKVFQVIIMWYIWQTRWTVFGDGLDVTWDFSLLHFAYS